MVNYDKDTSRWVLGGLLALIFVLIVALVFVYSRAGDTTTGESPSTSASITNTAPNVDTVTVAYTNGGANIPAATGIDLAIGSSTAVHVYGTVSDANGTDDIASTSLVFYRSGVSGGVGCSANGNSCYVATCTLSAHDSTSQNYDCPISLAFYTDSTAAGGEFPGQNWLAQVTVSDQAAATGAGTATTSVNTLLALNIPTSIDYGSFGLGAQTTSANNQQMVLTQRGNAEADVAVSGTSMTCSSIGSIPVGNQAWALTSVGYGSSTPLTGSAVNTIADVLFRHSDITDSTKTLYWNIKIPASGVKGTCAGTDTVTVQAH